MNIIKDTIITSSDSIIGVNRIPLYIDWDGVVVDTNRYIRDLLLKEYGIDKWTHKRENVEDDKKVAEFFKNFKWCDHFEKIPQINGNSFKVLNVLADCGIFYEPIIYSACSSEEEKELKRDFIFFNLPKCKSMLINNKDPKQLTLSRQKNYNTRINLSILVDDDPFNLNAWKKNSISIPFNGGNPYVEYPTMENLEELLHLFLRIEKNGEEFIPLYDDGRWRGYDLVTKFDINPDTRYLETDTMRNNYEKKLLMKK